MAQGGRARSRVWAGLLGRAVAGASASLLLASTPPPAHTPLAPLRSPWAGPAYEGLLVECSRKGLLSLGGFQALWAYTTAADPRATLAYALYLG